MSEGSSSGFEKVGFSDVESVLGGEEENKKQQKETVVVEFSQEQLETRKKNPHAAAESDFSSCSESTSSRSSFIPVAHTMSRLAIRSSQNDDNSSASWSRAEGGGKTECSSVVSGFDILSLGGGTKRRCKNCTFLNGEYDAICNGCGLALVANPCADIDEQLAKSLAKEEERRALEDLQIQEKKRKSLAQQPLLFQARTLVSDVAGYVASASLPDGFSTLPEAHSVVLASRFIEAFDEYKESPRVSLAYHFSEKFEWRMRQIRQDSFGPYARFSANIEAAMANPGNVCDVFPRRGSSQSTPKMPSIPEQNQKKDAEEKNPKHRLGWIAATLQGCQTFYETKVRAANGDYAIVNTFYKSVYCLPLICFDASLHESEALVYLVNGLARVCEYFFTDRSLSDPPEAAAALETTHLSKRIKMDRVSEPVAIVAPGSVADMEPTSFLPRFLLANESRPRERCPPEKECAFPGQEKKPPSDLKQPKQEQQPESNLRSLRDLKIGEETSTPTVSSPCAGSASKSTEIQENCNQQEEGKRDFVVNQPLRDHYGDKGNYTGLVLRSTGMPEGKGEMIYDDGRRTYAGGWHNGRWHGRGTANFANGESYEGDYQFDQRHGCGVYRWRDGRVYSGQFNKDNTHGKGVFAWPDGSSYDGEFVDGKRDGQGCYTYSDGGKYNGAWKDGLYHGYGTCMWVDGRCYEGEWRNGLAHGRGIETFPDGSVRHDGQWDNDEPILEKF